MGVTSPYKHHSHSHSHSLTRKLLPCAIFSILPVAIFHLYWYHPPGLPYQSTQDQLLHSTDIVLSTSFPPSSSSHEKRVADEVPCDYTDGRWVPDKTEPLYNARTCGTIKESRNCIVHGRPDVGYLYWQWKPRQCQLPRFDSSTFLQLMRNKHLAFVGDSLARNQQESLLCTLETVSTPNLVYSDGWVDKFRRWHFDSHNLTVSAYWSPFLVRGVERSSSGPNHNEMFLDEFDDRWVRDLDHMDMIILSNGHWFLNPSVYYENGSVLGCHLCPAGHNHTEIGFYGALGKALNTAFTAIVGKKGTKDTRADVVLTSFPPAHFEGEWDKNGACPKTEPYKEGEKFLDGMDSDIRGIQVKQVEAAKEKAKPFEGLRIEMLDITKLSLMRPDGHPGPYMHPFPFANGTKERVQNDCVHWCLPGPVDTWNQILLAVMKRWDIGSGGED